MACFEFRSALPYAPQLLYRYHLNPGAFLRLVPPWENVRLYGLDRGIAESEVRRLRVGVGPLAIHWTALHRDFRENEQFVDEQVEGPFRSWEHLHLFENLGNGQAALCDRIHYSFPLGLPLAFTLSAKLRKAFRYRHRQTLRDLTVITRFPSPIRDGPALKIGVTGAGGFVGRALTSLLRVAGHKVIALSREVSGREESGKVVWWPEPDLEALEGFDAVIHLAGETVAQPWTTSARERIYFSRVEGTKRLASALARLKRKPAVLISTSATGYYEQDSHAPTTEVAPPGEGFLSRVCQGWEAGTIPAEEAGIRVCHARFGLVLGAGGGLLQPQLAAFKFGLGAVLGEGTQRLPIIDRDDLVAAIYHLMHRDDLSGPFNVTAPQQPTQEEFAHVLASACSRPLLLRLPERPARTVLGEQADMFFRGVEALPTRLTESGFEFLAYNADQSLRHQMSLP